MKVEAWLFGAGAFFFTPIAIVYGYITNWKEPLGPTGIFLVAGLCVMIGGYLALTARKLSGVRPEDDQHGEISQGAGELGEFAPYSWAPLWLGAASAITFAGLAVGWWLVVIGVVLVGLAAFLWVFEYYRGEHAH